jgi:signal transduction protein with GAF and PtsI domain
MPTTNTQIYPGPIPEAELGVSVTPLLELALTECDAEGAYIYHFDRDRTTACAIVWSGLPPVSTAVAPEVQGPKAVLHFVRAAPYALQENAWLHPTFQDLPEFRTNRFEGLVSVPLLESGQPSGMVNFCRLGREGLKPRQFSFLLALCAPIAGFLAASRARWRLAQEVEELARRFSDRKIIERAKGVIQARLDWTEEQAYFCIRNLSRRKRIPMRTVAEEVIATDASGIPAEGAR